MSAETNTALLKKAAEAFKRGDIKVLLNAFSDTAKLHVDTSPDGSKRSYTGREGIAQHFAELAKREETVEFQPEEFIAQGDKVVVIYKYRGRVFETGKTYGIEAAHLFVMRDGLIQEAREYHDTAAEAAAYAK